MVHENRGLVEHIKDVTRRTARAGFVALGVDLLSRQGGTQQFNDPVSQAQAYSQTTQYERRSDLIAGLSYLKLLPNARYERIGIVGFCAGGGNVWDQPDATGTVIHHGVDQQADDVSHLSRRGTRLPQRHRPGVQRRSRLRRGQTTD